MAKKVKNHWTQKEWEAYGRRVKKFWHDLHELSRNAPPYVKAADTDALLRMQDRLVRWTMKIENIAIDYYESGGSAFFEASRETESPQALDQEQPK